jgi:hypothetical protein
MHVRKVLHYLSCVLIPNNTFFGGGGVSIEVELQALALALLPLEPSLQVLIVHF